MASVSYRTIEFHRFGGSANLLAPDNRYIRTAGWDTVAKEVSPSLDHRAFQRNLNMLRYGPAKTGDVARAQAALAAEAARFLDGVQSTDDQLLQLDLVTSAAELWAFPFEASFAVFEDWLAAAKPGVVITRRIRGDFSDHATPWPITPRVLFLHAPAAADLAPGFIAEHIAELTAALAPWTRGKDVIASGLLAVHEATSLDDISRHRTAYRPTHIHMLAHGAPAPIDPFLPDDLSWGLRLGEVGRAGIPPVEIAEVLQPSDDLPVVVTIAACDSGNQANPIFAGRSLAQELHRLGVPVVIGSQLPLTKPGSCTLTRSFYRQLLLGEDVRASFHAARVALKANQDAGHDWLSMVGYVRLPPEGYAAYLDEMGLRVDLRLLDAAQARADALSLAAGGEISSFSEIEQLVRERLHSLNRRKARFGQRKDLLNECCGLEASAYKRLAELLFVRGMKYPDRRDADWKGSADILRRALDAYRTAWEADLHSHWLGMQQLALGVALGDAARRPGDFDIIERAAQIAKQAGGRQGTNGKPSEAEMWAHGTLTELALLAPKVGRSRDLELAKAHAAELVRAATALDTPFAIQSTRRQLNRYLGWWTREHGFFAGADDLARDARELVAVLPEV